MLSARRIGGTGFGVCISIDPHDSAHHHNFTCDNEVQSIPGILESKLWSHIHWESVQHQDEPEYVWVYVFWLLAVSFESIAGI